MLQENATHTVLSMFNNLSNGVENKANASVAIILIIDQVLRHVSLLKQYEAPKELLLSISQGSMQRLQSSGNVFVGWGKVASMTEYAANGKPVFHASFAAGQSYRAYKGPWVGLPSNAPDLWIYARNTTPTATTTFYVSWNGATEVDTWRFFAEVDGTGEFELVSQVRKSGFETMGTVTRYHRRGYAEAIMVNGSSLGNSTIIDTWTPSRDLANFCDDHACPREESLQVWVESNSTQQQRPRADSSTILASICNARESSAMLGSLVFSMLICVLLVLGYSCIWAKHDGLHGKPHLPVTLDDG
jgi:hypothetical protein